MSAVKSTPRIARGSNVKPDWMSAPNRPCSRESDMELFYHPEGERGPERIDRAEQAKAVCRTCPFMDACRQYARDTHEPYGTWGGESEAERAKFLSRPGPKPKPKPKAPEPKPKREPVVRLTVIPTDIGNARPRARVDAGPVRRHLLALVDAGATRLEIANAAGLTYNSVVEIASGRTKQVTVVTCAALMAVRVAETAAAA